MSASSLHRGDRGFLGRVSSVFRLQLPPQQTPSARENPLSMVWSGSILFGSFLLFLILVVLSLNLTFNGISACGYICTRMLVVTEGGGGGDARELEFMGSRELSGMGAGN